MAKESEQRKSIMLKQYEYIQIRSKIHGDRCHRRHSRHDASDLVEKIQFSLINGKMGR